MIIGVLDEYLEGQHSQNQDVRLQEEYITWENQEFIFGHVKCEMSFNILCEMLNRQMETEVRSVVQGRGRT